MSINNILNVILLAVVAFVTYLYYKEKVSKKFNYDKEELNKKVKEIREEKQAQLDEYKNELKERFKEKEDLLKEKLESQNQIILEKKKLKWQEEVKNEEDKMRQKILDLQIKLDEKEDELDRKFEELHEAKEDVNRQKTEILEKEENLTIKERELDRKQVEELEKISKLSQVKAKEQLLDKTKEEMGADFLVWQEKMLNEAKEDADSVAREIVSLAMQRCSSEVANEVTVTTVKLNSDDDKGKIIGKAGRNIQWLEKTLGVEVIIDETPELVTISGFNSIRRHIAKRTIEKLLEDGRIHPSSIEDMYAKSKAEISKDIEQAGRWAINELGIYDFPDKLVRIIGRLKFRTSYGQNMLTHSVEMARLAKILAEDLNERFPTRKPIDVMICVKGALLHDIGKALDEEAQPKGNHITLGEKVCDAFALDWRIRKCISSHHDESYQDSEKGLCLEAVIVDACDNISGGRPGARKESMEAYYQRMEALEKIAEDTPGVSKSWIMRGSRELWVFFDTEKVSPNKMHELTKEITKRIQTDVTYPGEIKVVGLWEGKVVEYAN